MAQSKEFVDASHALNDLSHALALLESENASLRGAADGLCDENAKLRELSSIMLKCIMANERKALICWECPMHKQFDELRSYCCLKHEASEMGIEVTK